jgi:hypothetical protein
MFDPEEPDMDELQEIENQPDDLPKEEIEAEKRVSRINALVAITVMLLLTFAPARYKIYAPLPFLIPIILLLARRFRKVSNMAQQPKTEIRDELTKERAAVSEPYTNVPRDPKDPRRYKPIG